MASYIILADRYGLTPQTNPFGSGHRKSRLFDEFSLSEAQSLHPHAYRRITDQGLGVDRFMGLTRGSAAALDACWEGHILTPDYNGYCSSRNSIVWPEGEYWLNYTYELSLGEHIGAGINGYYANSMSSTHLVYWHEAWLAPSQNVQGATNAQPALSGDQRIGGTASERYLVRNVNWGDNFNSGYHEGFTFDGFRLSGTRKGIFGSGIEGYCPSLFDPWTPTHGLGIWKAGEASRIGRVYVEGFNGYGIMFVGGTPVFADTISVFNNRFGGLGLIGTALATLNFGTISGDDNPCLLDMRGGAGYNNADRGGQINIGLVKSETGTHPGETQDWYYKGQIVAELRGQFSVNIGTVSYACGFVETDAAFTVDSRLVGGGEQASNLTVGSFMGFNYKAVVHDTNRNKAWLSPNDYRCFGFEWNFIGGNTGGTDQSHINSFMPLGLTTNNADSRMGWYYGSTGVFDYSAGTPLYSYIGPTGSTGSTGASPTPGVTAVNAYPGSYNVPFGSTTSLAAVVEGTGSFGTGIVWAISSGTGTITGTTANPAVFVGPTFGTPGTVTITATSSADGTKLDTLVLSTGVSSSGNTGSTGATVGLLANYTFGGTSAYYIVGTTGPVMRSKYTWMAATGVTGGKLVNSNSNASYVLAFPVVRKIILRGLRLTDTDPRYQKLFSNIGIDSQYRCELEGELLAMNVGQLTPGVTADITINIPAGTAITHFLNGPGDRSAARLELDGLELYDWI